MHVRSRYDLSGSFTITIKLSQSQSKSNILFLLDRKRVSTALRCGNFFCKIRLYREQGHDCEEHFFVGSLLVATSLVQAGLSQRLQ